MKSNTFSVQKSKVLRHTKTRVAILVTLLVALNMLVPVLLPGTQATASAAANQEFPVNNYIDPQYLNELPWGKQSFYVQPWRAYMDTVPATQLQAGVGINYTLPENADDDAAVGVLSRAGFTHMRLEMSWTKVNYAETGLMDGVQDRYTRILTAMKKYGVTPLILLNANDGIPGPNLQTTHKVVGNFKAGATTITLDSVADLTPKLSGISDLTRYKMNEILFTGVNTANKTVTLSMPLPVDLSNNQPLQINTFKYAPFYPVGTPEFDKTMSGWLKYTKMMLDIVKNAGITNFDVEVWNELTFGSDFLSINNYYANPVATFPSPFRPGGVDYEMGNQTNKFIKANYSGANVIWGFSNTSFYENSPEQLPDGTDGMSYHPYGTDKKVTSTTYPDEGRQSWFIEGYIPQVVKSQPEGWAHDGVKTETLTHLLNPQARLDKPAGTDNFMHYLTEHGSTPSENGITDTATALAFKQKSLIRSLLFWLNKGIDKVDIFSAWQDDPLSNGQLNTDIDPKDYAKYTDDQIMTPGLKSLQNMMAQFKGAVNSPLKRQLDVDVTSLGTQYTTFKGDATHPDMYDRDLFTFLPFQVSPTKFVVGTYVMSYDITTPLPSMDFKQTIKNVSGLTANVTYYDPITNQNLPVNVVSRDVDSITVITPNVDYPRLLTIDENPISSTARGPLSVRSSVQITSPVNNAKVASNTTIILKAAAQDSTGISKVEYYANDQLVCTTNSAASSCRWDVAKGNKMKYIIKVIAYNNNGDTQSSSIQVTTT